MASLAGLLLAGQAAAELPVEVINRNGAAIVRLEVQHNGEYSCYAQHRNRILTRLFLSDTRLGETPESMGLGLHRLGLNLELAETLDMTSLTLSGAPQSILTMLGVIDATIGRASLPAKAIAREIASLPLHDQRSDLGQLVDSATSPADGESGDHCPLNAETVELLRSTNWQTEYESQAQRSGYSLAVVGDTSSISMAAFQQRLMTSRGIPAPPAPQTEGEEMAANPRLLRRDKLTDEDARAAEGYRKLYELEPTRSSHEVVWRLLVPGRKFTSPAIVERLAARLRLEVLTGIDGASANMPVTHRVIQGNNGGWIDITAHTGLQYASEVAVRGSAALQAALRDPKLPTETASISLASMSNRAIAENLMEWERNSLPTSLQLEALNKNPTLVFYSVESKDRSSAWALLASCVMLGALFFFRRRL